MHATNLPVVATEGGQDRIGIVRFPDPLVLGNLTWIGTTWTMGTTWKLG